MKNWNHYNYINNILIHSGILVVRSPFDGNLLETSRTECVSLQRRAVDFAPPDAMSHCSTAPCRLPDTPEPLGTLMCLINPLCLLKNTTDTRAKNPPRSPSTEVPTHLDHLSIRHS